MKKFIYLVPFIIIIFTYFCCNKVVEPSQNDVRYGSRNYDWHTDTINSGSIQTFLTSIWGTSYHNIFICGYDANNSTNVYSFNGYNWVPVQIQPTSFLKSYSVITGLDSNYFILSGTASFINNNPPPNFLDSGLVVEFENGNYTINYLNNSYGVYCLCIISRYDYWVGDKNGNLLHFQDNKSNKYHFNKNIFFNGLVSLNGTDIYATAHYELITGSDYQIIDYLLYYQNNKWTFIDSNVVSNLYNRISFSPLIKNIDGQLYGSGDIGIVKRDGNSWKVIGEGLHGQINGTDENNIFLGNQDYGVMHFNGKDWYKFNDLPNLRYSGIEVFNNSVFLLASDGSKTFVVRGIKNK